MRIDRNRDKILVDVSNNGRIGVSNNGRIGVSLLFHLAAIHMVQFSIEHPLKTHDVNVNGTINLLEMCRKHGVKRFVFASSAAVYGDIEEMPLKEDMKLNPVSPYGLHKLIGEYYCRLYNLLYGVKQ